MDLRKDLDEFREKNNQVRFIAIENTPLQFMVGVDNTRLMVCCSYEYDGSDIAPPESLHAVEVGFEKFGTSNLIKFTVTEPTFEDQFIKIMEDLICATIGASSEKLAISRLLSRFNDWRLFWRRKGKGLTREQVQGLVGELLYMEHLLLANNPVLTVVNAWHGVESADQDFVFDSSWSEVKTIQQDGVEVHISSLEQLENPMRDISNNIEGRLVVVRLHTDPVGDSVFQLADLVRRIEDKVAMDPFAKRRFDSSLELTRADLENGKYEKTMRFALMEMKQYLASAVNFPRLVRSQVPVEVTRAEYRLSLSALSPWLIEE